MVDSIRRAMTVGKDGHSMVAGPALIVVSAPAPFLGSDRDDTLAALLTGIGLRVVDHLTNGEEAVSEGSAEACIVNRDEAYALADLASKHPNARFLLFFENVADYLAPVLAHGDELGDAYKHWSEANQQRLAFLRRHRSRAILIDYTAARKDPVALAAICGQIGLELPVPRDCNSSNEEPLVLERWLASQWVKSRTETEMLEAELEASAHPLNEEPPTESIAIEPLLNAYSHRVAHDRAMLDEAKGDNDSLRQQKDELVAKVESQQGDLEASEKQRREALQSAEALQIEKDGLVEENELLLLQLHKGQEELEATLLENWELQQDSATLKKIKGEIDTLRQHNSAMLEKTKGEIDALRLQRNELAAKVESQQNDLEASDKQRWESVHLAEVLQAEKDALVEETEMLLLQLHQIQEELELHVVENKKLKSPVNDPSSVDAPSTSIGLEAASAAQRDQSKQAHQPKSLWSRYSEWRKLRMDKRLLASSEWFDEAWYLETYADVAETDMDAAEHYLRYGAAEGRNPSPRFNTRDYLEVNTDVEQAGVNPLLHYIRFGKDEGRTLAPSRSVW